MQCLFRKKRYTNNLELNQHTHIQHRTFCSWAWNGLFERFWMLVASPSQWCSRARDVSIVKVCKTTEPLQNLDKDIKMSSLATEETVSLFLLPKITVINLLSLGQMTKNVQLFSSESETKQTRPNWGRWGLAEHPVVFPNGSRGSAAHMGGPLQKNASQWVPINKIKLLKTSHFSENTKTIKSWWRWSKRDAYSTKYREIL